MPRLACTAATTDTGTNEGSPDPAASADGGAPLPNGLCPAKDPSAVTSGPTTHEGEVTGNETWTAEGSPHVVRGELNVRDGAKLTIAPCAVVQLVENASINVAYPLTPNTGELVAEGTADAPIRFEGKDAARWNRIYVHAPGTARFSHVTLVDGGGGDSWGHETIGVTGDGELPRKPLVFVDNVRIEGSRGAGMYLDYGAAFIAGSQDLVITGSGKDNAAHPYPLELGESAIDGLPTGTYTGNAKDEIKIVRETISGASGFKEDTTMHDRGVPYHVGDLPEDDDLYVGDGTRAPVLTIEPGVKILFEKDTALRVEGHPGGAAAIRALGTADKPIVFTSGSSTPAPGDWRGFFFNGPISAKNALEDGRPAAMVVPVTMAARRGGSGVPR